MNGLFAVFWCTIIVHVYCQLSERTIISSTSDELTPWQRRADAVRGAMQSAWAAYERTCTRSSTVFDELKPVSATCGANDNAKWNNRGLSVIDSLDTLWIMGLKEEFSQALSLAVDKIALVVPGFVNVFETSIRGLGGLISAYELSGDAQLLQKAEQLGRALLPAFATPSGIPVGILDLVTHQGGNPPWWKHCSLFAEAATLQLEFAALSRHTGDPVFADTAHKAVVAIEESRRNLFADELHLFPTLIDPTSGLFERSAISTGARADSAYEYFLKLAVWYGSSEGLLPQPAGKCRGTGGTMPHPEWISADVRAERFAFYRQLYMRSVNDIFKHLVRRQGHFVFVQDIEYEEAISDSRKVNISKAVPTMNHLSCFLPGTLASGVLYGVVDGQTAVRHLDLAKSLMETCLRMYSVTATGLASESYVWSAPTAAEPNGQILLAEGERSFKLRPETLESLYFLYRATGEEQFRDQSWSLFERILRMCKVSSGGFSGVTDVQQLPVHLTDTQDSYFLAETLKYAYLTALGSNHLYEGGFDPDCLVFNTEAHPVRLWMG